MPMTEKQKRQINTLMKQASILGVAVAEFDPGSIKTETFGYSNTIKDPKTPVVSETVFGVASLSKTVFAYLVNEITKDPEYAQFTLDTPLYTIVEDKQISGNPAHKELTARLILSHQSGWPNKPPGKGQQPEFQFPPGKGFAYSGLPYGYLQRVIEKVTGKSLEECAKKYVFDPLKMKDTTFIPLDKGMQLHPANSLCTTVTDYALFCMAAMNKQELFENVCPLSPERDPWAAKQGLSKKDLQKVAWGVGWGLQKTAQGKVTRAFHYGDMGRWRAFVALDLKRNKGVAFFTNSSGGLMLTDTIVSDVVELKDGLKFVFEKFGFARKIGPDWQKKERLRIDGIIERNMPDLWIDIQKHRAAEAEEKTTDVNNLADNSSAVSPHIAQPLPPVTTTESPLPTTLAVPDNDQDVGMIDVSKPTQVPQNLGEMLHDVLSKNPAQATSLTPQQPPLKRRHSQIEESSSGSGVSFPSQEELHPNTKRQKPNSTAGALSAHGLFPSVSTSKQQSLEKPEVQAQSNVEQDDSTINFIPPPK